MSLKTGGIIAQSDFTGMVWPSVCRVPPGSSEWLACDGSAVSRSTYSALFAIVCPSSTITVTIASPGVVTWTGHNLITGDTVVFSTNGALPTGITAGTLYYVSKKDANSFWLFDTQAHALADNGAGTGTGIKNTSGSQSGTHTGRSVNFGNGDGSTTFNVPDMQGRIIMGAGSGSGLTKRNLGDKVGEETHQLTTAELASHSHVTQIGSGAGGGANFGPTSVVNDFNSLSDFPATHTSGSDTAHNNIQPSVSLYYYIHV